MANSKRKCASCKNYFRPERTFPGAQAWCSDACGAALAMARLPRQKKKQEQEARKQATAEARKLRESNKAYQFDLTKKAAQKLAVMRDTLAGFGCISCGTTADVQYCGGHYKTVGAHRELALDLRNIHKQCNRRCNMALSGNIHGHGNTHGYKAGLLARYGERYLAYLEREHPMPRYSCEELIEMRKGFNAEYRRLNKILEERQR